MWRPKYALTFGAGEKNQCHGTVAQARRVPLIITMEIYVNSLTLIPSSFCQAFTKEHYSQIRALFKRSEKENQTFN